MNGRFTHLSAAAALVLSGPLSPGRALSKPQSQFAAPSTQTAQRIQDRRIDTGTEPELQTGIDLARQGRFREAIPHFLAVRGRVSDQFAADFNLALCYVATGQDQEAIAILHSILTAEHPTAGVYNLLAQAFIGISQPEQASEAFQKAVALEPRNEKLYLLLADSCIDHESYDLGLKIITAGLQRLPGSARLHYQRAIVLSSIDEPDKAREDLRLASEFAPGASISFLADAQRGLLDGDIPQAVRAAREGVRKEPENYVLLTILGQALIRDGVVPGQTAFDEAQTAIEKSVAQRPGYAIAQAALGQLYLLAGRLSDAIAHLEQARQLVPHNSLVYSQLAVAYRRTGEVEKAETMLATLAALNERQAAKFKLEPADHKSSYVGSPKQ